VGLGRRRDCQTDQKTRDESFEPVNDKGVTVNRTQAMAFLGGAANKQRGMLPGFQTDQGAGVVNLEHQARI